MTTPGQSATDHQMLTALLELHARTRWPRLEASFTPGNPPTWGGYCLTPDGTTIDTAAALTGPDSDCPGPIRELAGLLSRTGWQRVELITGSPPGQRPHGTCRRPDGTYAHLQPHGAGQPPAVTAPAASRPHPGRTAPATTPTPAPPAVDPALPARTRRRLLRYRAARYTADPATVTPSRTWRNRWAAVLALLNRNENRDSLFVSLLYLGGAGLAALQAWSGTRTGWAGLVIVAAALTVPAIPSLRAAWTSWRHRGHYIDHADLNGPARALLTRAQTAISAITASPAAASGHLEDPRPALPWHEWEIATTLLGLTRAQQHHGDSPHTTAALHAVTARVTALEGHATALRAAATALLGAGPGGPTSLQLDLAAASVGHHHHTAHLTTLTRRAAKLATTLTSREGL